MNPNFANDRSFKFTNSTGLEMNIKSSYAVSNRINATSRERTNVPTRLAKQPNIIQEAVRMFDYSIPETPATPQVKSTNWTDTGPGLAIPRKGGAA